MRNSISTNILRDSDRDIQYIVTPNAKDIYNTIFSSNNTSQRSFVVVGNYGTGKSSFLWALEKNLKNETLFFNTSEQTIPYDFVKVVGDTQSLKKSLAESVGSDDIVGTLERRVSDGQGLVILIDEFGKFLEQISKSDDFDDLYLLQKIAEWANDDTGNVYFILTLHQSFTSYASNLNSIQQREWEKIKGRFREIAFNEPVEQLVYFASEYLKELNTSKSQEKKSAELNQLIFNSKLTGLKDLSNSRSLYPLDWLSTHILVNALQRYGQNERSLFSFLNNRDNFSVNQHKGFYAVSDVYNYLISQLSTFLSTPYNPHRSQWNSIDKNLEKAELLFEGKEYLIAEEVIKLIGLVNIFGSHSGVFNNDFIIEYISTTKGLDPKKILDRLEKHNLIRFYRYSNKVNFLDGTDIDLEFELTNITKEVNANFNLASELERLVDLPIVLAKEFSYTTGTNRFFEFKVFASDGASFSHRKGIDGNIYIALSLDKENVLDQISLEYPEDIFLLHAETALIKEDILLIHKYEKLVSKFKSDTNALELIEGERKYQVEQLQERLQRNIYEEGNVWISGGVELSIYNDKDLNVALSKNCHQLYHKTPRFINELINRESLSTPIKTAKKRLIQQLLEFESQEGLGFAKDKFPAEKSIYLSLLQNTGIHQPSNVDLSYYQLDKPAAGTALIDVWKASEEFIESAKTSKQGIDKLYEKLSLKPYKLKSGFIAFWVPIFLIAKREDFALFHKDSGFIPYLKEDTLHLIERKPQDFLIKSYDVSGLRLNLLESYKELVNIQNSTGSASTFISIYANFLRFYRGLNDYSKHTNLVSKQTKKLREAIKESKDPEDALFVNFPIALGFDSNEFSSNAKVLEEFINHIQTAIRELRNAYSELLDKVEYLICDAFGMQGLSFEAYKSQIVELLTAVDPVFLSKAQNTFYRRLVSPLDQRDSWLKSVSDVVLGKPLEKMIDEEFPILVKDLKDRITGLIKSSEIHAFNSKSNHQKILSVRVFDETGNFSDQSVVVKESKDKTQIKGLFRKELQRLNVDERKEILIQMLTESIDE